jgi:thioredoxin 1
MKTNVKKLRPTVCFTTLVFLVLLIPTLEIAKADEFNNLPVKGMVTMIDLGAQKCIPCKMMAPILEKMKKVYKGKAVIAFIDVWEHREPVNRFGIRAIPTQIFFDKNGQEVYRHEGFLAEKNIVAILEKMGVK